MDLIYLGKITSFHGIKGELRIISDFDYIDDAFKVGNEIIIDKESHIIKSYRKHKNYKMITIDDFNNINDVLYLKNKKVYISRDVLNINKVLDNDLIGMKVVCNNKETGIIKRIEKISLKKKIIVVEYKKKEVLVPYEFIEDINIKDEIVTIRYIEGLGL